jgi:large subunit ribosomal protein L29
MKAAELREMTDAELQLKEREFKKELFNFRFQVSTGQQMNTAGLTVTKRKIARLKTILRERQLAQQKTLSKPVAVAKPKPAPEPKKVAKTKSVKSK